MNAEVHVMCLEGEEKGAVYGGIDWGYTFSLKDRSETNPQYADYAFSSYLTRITTPSSTYRVIIGHYLQTHDSVG